MDQIQKIDRYFRFIASSHSITNVQSDLCVRLYDDPLSVFVASVLECEGLIGYECEGGHLPYLGMGMLPREGTHIL